MVVLPDDETVAVPEPEKLPLHPAVVTDKVNVAVVPFIIPETFPDAPLLDE